MLVHNLTIKVDKQILAEWMKWIRSEYIPGVMATQLFNDNKFFELLDLNDDESSTFVLQCFTDSRENYDKFINDHWNILNQRPLKKWKDNFIAFTTLMQTVH